MIKGLIKYLTIFIAIGLSNNAWAQVEAKVIMYNNAVIKGELININEIGDVILLLNKRDTLRLNHHLVKKYYVNGLKTSGEFEREMVLNRYKFHTVGSLHIGEISNGWGFHQSFNRKVFNALYSGLTLGIDNYTGNAELNVYSVGANMRYFFTRLPKLPYISLNAGYGSFLALQKYNQVASEGGMYWNPSAGFTFGKKISFDLSMGLRFQNTGVTYQLGETESEINWKYRRISINLGVSF